jgi:hypothetical protein
MVIVSPRIASMVHYVPHRLRFDYFCPSLSSLNPFHRPQNIEQKIYSMSIYSSTNIIYFLNHCQIGQTVLQKGSVPHLLENSGQKN